MTITVTVTNRIATISATERIVAGNTYPVAFVLDSEWTGSLFMRVRFGSQYYDIPFASSDTTVNVQFPVGYPEVGIGVFSEALEICSNEVRVRLLRSILEQGVSVVDFDSDLYDQWAGEVSELLCDDDFDAESERPVKNSVITAWKNTVPLDSALVHRTGEESIGGLKTFTSSPIIAGTQGIIRLKSNLAVGSTGWRGQVQILNTDGSTQGQIASSVENGGFGALDMRAYKADASGYFGARIQAYSDHMVVNVTPYYPTDSGGNPQPLGASALVASGNIAVDPRIVHTTGTETIAGDKTFTGMPTVSGTQATLDMASTTSASTTGWKAQFRYRDQSSLVASTIVMTGENTTQVETRVYKPDRSNYYWMRHTAYSDHELLTVQPYYPVDGSGNPQPLTAGALVSSGNIAIDPRLVHTTGNETIAGNKTLRGNLAIESSYPLVEMHCTSDVGTTGTKGAINFLEGGSSVGKSSLFAYQASNMRQMMLRHFRDGSGFADIGVVLTDTNLAWGEAPSYTADNNADAKIVTRTMLAQTPTVVHTTGNETIAGTKTFTSKVIVKNSLTYNSVEVASKGRSQSFYSRMYADNGTDYDQTFLVGTTYSTDTVNYLRMAAFSPRVTTGDTSEAQAVVNLNLKVGQDETMEAYLTADTKAGEHKNLTIATFDGTNWHPAWESNR